MGQQQSSARPRQFDVPPKTVQRGLPTSQNAPRMQHEGILKLRQIPFRNSIQISHNPPLFLQCSDTTLSQLLGSRYNSTKLFTQQDILKLLESILYTLSYLQSQKTIYPDLSSQNIFYDTQTGTFKLLPIELVRESAYKLSMTNKKFSYLSPELVLAMRYGETETEIENEIMTKANVFTLGMVLLEVCTLRSSAECYDGDSYDILDEVVRGRLGQVREFYPEMLVRYIEAMLEYDYGDRPDPKQLSIELNRDMRESRIGKAVVGKMQNMQGPPQQQQYIPQIPQQNPSIANSNVQYKPQLNLSRSQLRYLPKEQHQSNSPYNMPPPPPLKPVQSAQYPSASGYTHMSPSPVKVERSYSQQQPTHVHYFQPHMGSNSPYGGHYGHQYSQETQTPRYPGDYQQESSSELLALPPPPPAPPAQHYKPSTPTPYNLNPYSKPTYQPQSQSQPQYQPPPRTSLMYEQQQIYRSPIDQTRVDKLKQQTPTKNITNITPQRSSQVTSNIVANFEQENKRGSLLQARQGASYGVFKDYNQQQQDKSPGKARRAEYVSPILDDEITDNSISRLKEQIEKSRKLIMQFQRMQGMDNAQAVHKSKKYQPA